MDSKTTFSCGDALDIVHVKSMHDRLQKSLQKSSCIELKADKVQKVDTAGLQLIIALSRQVQQVGGQLIWKKPSDYLINSARNLGLAEALQLPVAEVVS